MYTFFVHFCNKAVNTAILPLFSARDDWILRAYYVIVLSECNTDASEPCSFRAVGDPKSFDAFTKGFIFERRKNMKKRILSLVLALLFTVGIFGSANSAFAMEDGDYRIVFGADLTDEQRSQVIGMFGIQGEVDENRILTVTNAEERLYFEGKLPSGQIGQRSISSIYICAMPAGSGLDIKTYNIDYCTEEMYRNVLTTVGITDAKIIVASPRVVSGTAALTGVYKAYESLTGNILSEYAKMAGVDELIATGQLAEMIGSDEATEVINELKKILDETQKMTDDEVKQKIREIADDNDVSLTETEISQILTLARTLEGLDVEQLRARAYGLADATRKATGWKKFTEGAKQTLEDIGNFFKDVAQFLRDLFSKWFGGNNADTEPAK